MADTFIQEQIVATKALIVEYQNAVLDLTAGRIQRYTLDTGQSRQDVTKIDAAILNDQIDGLYNRLATLQARCTGSGVVIVRPAF